MSDGSYDKSYKPPGINHIIDVFISFWSLQVSDN
jgi:hypothetical protein